MNRRSISGVSLDLPQEWQNSTEEGSTTFSFVRPSGAGALQFSVGLYHRGKKPDIGLDDLREMISEFSERHGLERGTDWLIREGQPLVVGASFSMQGRFLRVWYVSDGLNIALATYNCRWGDQGIEVAQCEEIVASLEFG